MAFNISKAFGVHGEAVMLRNRRMQVIASNIANADTPRYQARDFDFREAFAAARNDGARIRRTHARHLGASNNVADPTLKYRVPLQPTVDGNTVDAQFEQTAFADNAVRMQASLMFLDRKISGLRDAITGGQG